MRLTTKGRYAVTAMLDLALHNREGPTSLSAISVRQDISLSYLEQLFARLRRNGLVASVRGPGGGYRLARDPADLSVAQVVDAVSESMDATRCGGEASCQGGEKCLTHNLWEDLSTRIYEFLNDVSLDDLMARRDVLAIQARQDNQVAGMTVAPESKIATTADERVRPG